MNKYRIVDTERKEYAKDGDWSIGSQSGMVRGMYGEEFPKMIALLFTGIIDQDDEEIYCGDIVTNGVTEWEVGWHQQMCKWWLDPIIPHEVTGDDWILAAMNCESLGNGYLKRRDLTVVGNVNLKK